MSQILTHSYLCSDPNIKFSNDSHSYLYSNPDSNMTHSDNNCHTNWIDREEQSNNRTAGWAIISKTPIKESLVHVAIIDSSFSLAYQWLKEPCNLKEEGISVECQLLALRLKSQDQVEPFWTCRGLYSEVQVEQDLTMSGGPCTVRSKAWGCVQGPPPFPVNRQTDRHAQVKILTSLNFVGER